MPLHRSSFSKQYIHIYNQDQSVETRIAAPWYWRCIAFLSSWMILAGYLILPGLYAKEHELKISQAILSVFVVALLTAGYSFTALLCFACRDDIFQADSIFLPALGSSALGLLSIAYNFSASRSYVWGTAAITGTVISTTATLLYGFLVLWTHRRIIQMRDLQNGQQRSESAASGHLWSDPSFYTDWVTNGRGVAASSSSTYPTEDDRINAHLARLLARKSDDGSPDAASATFRIDLPEDREAAEREANSSELIGSPPPSALSPQAEFTAPPRSIASRLGHHMGHSRRKNHSLNEEAAWERWNRGRTMARPISVPQGGSAGASGSASRGHSRAMSREERRREIELGRV